MKKCKQEWKNKRGKSLTSKKRLRQITDHRTQYYNTTPPVARSSAWSPAISAGERKVRQSHRSASAAVLWSSCEAEAVAGEQGGNCMHFQDRTFKTAWLLSRHCFFHLQEKVATFMLLPAAPTPASDTVRLAGETQECEPRLLSRPQGVNSYTLLSNAEFTVFTGSSRYASESRCKYTFSQSSDATRLSWLLLM